MSWWKEETGCIYSRKGEHVKQDVSEDSFSSFIALSFFPLHLVTCPSTPFSLYLYLSPSLTFLFGSHVLPSSSFLMSLLCRRFCKTPSFATLFKLILSCSPSLILSGLGGRLSEKAEEIGRLKWGVGKLIADAKVTPIVIPIYHTGMQQVRDLALSS